MDDDDFAELFKKLPSRASTSTSWQDLIAEFGGVFDATVYPEGTSTSFAASGRSRLRR